MSREKDPAFLFYPKDWLQGTAKLMPEEKGVFIDLLAHQHQDGDLPTDTKRLAKMVGISERDFLQIWEVIKDKFELNSCNRLVNQKLTKVITERLTKSITNKITGTFAAVVRLSTASYDQKDLIKREFKATEFIQIPTEQLTERLTEWFSNRLKSIENGVINNITLVKIEKNGTKFSGNFKAQGEELLLNRLSRHVPNGQNTSDNGIAKEDS
jgi:uncharacterized protein YdaU (DUF1376 family)